MEDAALRATLRTSLAYEQRLLGTYGPDARVIERDGLVASVVAGVPDASLPNAAVPLRPDALTPALIDELDEAYAGADVHKWGVWLDPHEADLVGTVSAAGLVFDSHPTPMGAVLDELPLDGGPDAATITMQEAGRVNDLAYGHADNRLERLLAGIPVHAAQTYAVFDADAEAVSVVTVVDCDSDAAVWFVATVPWTQHQGHATRLLRRALADAGERGCTTTTLVASAGGAPVYEKLGYRPLGELQLWERRR
jgi:ribosomal protein S18 acetylase RimI-like enzyme